jgi:hypothetical protein
VFRPRAVGVRPSALDRFLCCHKFPLFHGIGVSGWRSAETTFTMSGYNTPSRTGENVLQMTSFLYAKNAAAAAARIVALPLLRFLQNRRHPIFIPWLPGSNING